MIEGKVLCLLFVIGHKIENFIKTNNRRIAKMSKLFITKRKFDFKNFIKSIFSSKKKIILICSILILIISICIIFAVVLSKQKEEPLAKEHITINVKIYLYGSQERDYDMIYGSDVYLDEENKILLLNNDLGEFVLDNYKNNFNLNDVIRIEKNGYDLLLNQADTENLYVIGSKVYFKVIKD